MQEKTLLFWANKVEKAKLLNDIKGFHFWAWEIPSILSRGLCEVHSFLSLRKAFLFSVGSAFYFELKGSKKLSKQACLFKS